MPRKKAVVLRGIHVSVHCPTEERLMVQLEGLSPDKFRKLAVALEDYFLVVDDAFKETWVKGRGWKGRGRRVTAKSRVRVLRFSPFPSRFSNILRTVRRNIYCELHKQCVVLEGTQLELLNRELERQRQELVIKAVENLRQNIQSIVKRIISQKKLDSKKAKKELARLRNIAVDVGLESLAISVIDPLTQVVENPERATELLGKDIPAEIDGRIKGLLESL